jgi:hypothetical protein
MMETTDMDILVEESKDEHSPVIKPKRKQVKKNANSLAYHGVFSRSIDIGAKFRYPYELNDPSSLKGTLKKIKEWKTIVE